MALILVAEDECAVPEFVCRALRHGGHEGIINPITLCELMARRTKF